MFVNIGDVAQKEMDWSLLPDRLLDSGLNRCKAVSSEFSINDEFDGSGLVRCENPNHAESPFN